jgi:hypothetical protein
MMGVVNSVHASTTHHRIDKGEVPMVHTKTRLSAEQANMVETKAWQPTGKLTKKHTIPITITDDEAERAELQM